MNLNEVMTLSEAAERWGLSESTLRMKFDPERERVKINELISRGLIRYSKKTNSQRGTWLITEKAMYELFGGKN